MGLCCLLGLTLSLPAWAQSTPPTTVASTTPEPPVIPESIEPPPSHRLIWRYPRFRWWEYAAAGVVAVGNISFEIWYDKHPPDRWTTPILADAATRRWLRADTKEGRFRAADISDYLWHYSTYYVLADGLVTPLASDKLNADVALQLTLLNWQAIGFAGLMARLTHNTVGRTRPLLQGCSNDPDAENPCQFSGASFVAGHAMMTSANAGLACANHYALPLYGGGVPDKLVCPVMVTAALSVGVLRIVADKHWLSDTVPGWIAGGGIGFGLPWLLHYGPTAVRKVAMPLPGTVLVPWANAASGGLDLMGAF